MADITLTTTSTLNGGSVTVTVYEDTTTDGTADNTNSVALSGGTDETNTLSGFDASTGNDYWIEADLGVTNESDDSPELDRAEVSF